MQGRNSFLNKHDLLNNMQICKLYYFICLLLLLSLKQPRDIIEKSSSVFSMLELVYFKTKIAFD